MLGTRRMERMKQGKTAYGCLMHSFSLVFSDGSRYLTDSAGKAQEELEAFFYRLAEEKEAV